jgi:hypothetical protein
MPSEYQNTKKPIEIEHDLPAPIPSPDLEKKGFLTRFEKIIKQIEALSFTPETQNNALGYLFYSLVNSANSILNSKTFRKRIEEASFPELIKGLEVLMDQILKLNSPSAPTSDKGIKRKTIEMRQKIKELEVMRKETVEKSQ